MVMKPMSVIFVAAVVVAIYGQVEGLKCYSCDYYTIDGGITDGDPSCENGKTPAAHLVADCTGDKSVCMLMFTDTNYGATPPSNMTRRSCSTQTPIGCTKVTPPPPATGTIVTCLCDKEKCNGGSIDDLDNQGDSSSTKLTASLISTLVFIFVATKSLF